jgi:hypothetical protein
MRTLLLVILLTLAASETLATPQAPDWIIYKGSKYPLLCNPLESLYENQARPKFMTGPGERSSGNQRGYQATWKLDDNRLFLISIAAWICEPESSKNCRPVELEKLFGNKYQHGKVFADWYSGELRLANGEVKRFLYSDYATIFEHEIFIAIKLGQFISVRDVDNSKRNFELEEQQEYERRKRTNP